LLFGCYRAGAIRDENSLINMGNSSSEMLLVALECVSIISNKDLRIFAIMRMLGSQTTMTKGIEIVALAHEF
jgi:hypothetical protein